MLRKWAVLEECYQRPEHLIADAQQAGERLLERCLTAPVSHPPADTNSTEILTPGALFSRWRRENAFADSCDAVRCEELPPEALAPEIAAGAIRPTSVQGE
jgi:hypothetical protein